MIKKTAIIISLIIIVGVLGVAIVGYIFENNEMKPGKDYITDYVSPSSPYAVQVLYDDNHHPIDIVIVKAKSGVSVAGIEQDAFGYKITETSSTITFVLYNNEGVEMGTYEFDTDKGEWVTSPISSVQNDLNGFEYRNNNYNFSVSFPKSWGNISEKITAGPKERKIYRTIQLTTDNDPERYIEINLVDVKLKEDPLVADAPMEFITKNSDFAFYFSGSADYAGAPGMEDPKYDQILSETKEIIKTFKLF